jgi:hypothetical protein
VIEKKWEGRDYTVQRRLARIRLVKTENPSACATVNCKVCRSAIVFDCGSEGRV